MRNIRCRKARCKSNPFDICAKRRREIVFHARLVGAADTEDFSRWLIAWIWHNPKATDQIWAVMEAAKRMGGKITEAEASDLTEEASITRKRLFETRERILADEMARFLGVTYDQRRKLGITAIGSIDVNKAGRKEIRRVRDKVKRRQKRRAAGVRPRAEYEANSLSKLKPWAAEGKVYEKAYRAAYRATPQFRERDNALRKLRHLRAKRAKRR